MYFKRARDWVARGKLRARGFASSRVTIRHVMTQRACRRCKGTEHPVGEKNNNTQRNSPAKSLWGSTLTLMEWFLIWLKRYEGVSCCQRCFVLLCTHLGLLFYFFFFFNRRCIIFIIIMVVDFVKYPFCLPKKSPYVSSSCILFWKLGSFFQSQPARSMFYSHRGRTDVADLYNLNFLVKLMVLTTRSCFIWP